MCSSTRYSGRTGIFFCIISGGVAKPRRSVTSRRPTVSATGVKLTMFYCSRIELEAAAYKHTSISKTLTETAMHGDVCVQNNESASDVRQ